MRVSLHRPGPYVQWYVSRRPYAPRLSVEDRRTQLLDAALAVIDRDGYGGVTIDAIAREAGVTRPVVYRIFDDLPALLFALLDRQEARSLGVLTDTMLRDGDPLEHLASLIEAVRADPQAWRPILLASSSTPAAVRERIDRDRALVREQLEAMIAPYTTAAEIDPGVAAHALIAVAEHFGRLLVEDPEGFDAEPLLTSVAALLRLV